ncbi:unnamed protein product [Staurois parvus]|uniref:Uncharacterized protein n=1 Tax=Staurois parvus TaxID=386267 RepID=A0ABN9GSG1_9NEOB|nr:unnamed protein product [Staurois parvus]
MVGVTSQGSEQGQQRIRQRQEQGTGNREQGTGNREQGPGETQHQGRVCRSECPLNTPV